MSRCFEIDKIQSALKFVSPHDRDVWVRMAMAVKSALSDDGFWLWNDWSVESDSYNERDAKSVWRSISEGGKVTIGTLFHEAKANGWEWKCPERKLTQQQIDAIKEQSRIKSEAATAEKEAGQAEAAKRAAEIWNASEPCEAHPYLTKKGVKSHGLRVGNWEIIDKETGKVRLISNMALLVPIKNNKGELFSLQAIFQKKMLAGRDKDNLAGGAKAGNFFAIGKPSDDKAGVFILCEGYATTASIYEAVNTCTIACFDTSNLLTVAAAIREKRPTATILFAADNDQFNRRKDGTPYNPGVEAARRAAIEVGGLLAIPQFSSLDGEPIDFNDMHQREGLDAVGRQIAVALKTGAVVEPEFAPATGTDIELAVSTMPGDHGRIIADAITAKLANLLDADINDERLRIDVSIVEAMINGSFWSGSKSKLFLLNDDQNLNQFHAGEAFKFLRRIFGDPVDYSVVADMTESIIQDRGLTKVQAKSLHRETTEAAGAVIMDHLKDHNQRDKIEWRCDMFAERAKLRLIEDKARIVLAHKEFEISGHYDQRIIDDYKDHFPRFDEFLGFLVQSRFALDRKKCYLWILADSDWGKGFLLGILKNLNLAVEISVKEVEAMFEGRPVGRAPEDFKRAFALVIDEFKTVKSELKQLQSEITLSPKNQLCASVEVFAKIFLSAESVASLVTENGVEDQFCNRMSIFEETGSLVNREVYIEVGNSKYFESLREYTAQTLNKLVTDMRAMRRSEAETYAERWINGFIKRNGLDTLYERFSDSLPRVANEAVRWVLDVPRSNQILICRDSGRRYITHAAKKVDEFLSENFDQSEIHAYRKRKREILKFMSADNRGTHPHTVNGRQIKSVWLKDADAIPGIHATMNYTHSDEYPI